MIFLCFSYSNSNDLSDSENPADDYNENLLKHFKADLMIIQKFGKIISLMNPLILTIGLLEL